MAERSLLTANKAWAGIEAEGLAAAWESAEVCWPGERGSAAEARRTRGAR